MDIQSKKEKHMTYIKDPRVARVLELTEQLRKNLEYPNSETSLDERRYTERFEAEVLEILDKPTGDSYSEGYSNGWNNAMEEYYN
jgi:hypothetical protein